MNYIPIYTSQQIKAMDRTKQFKLFDCLEYQYYSISKLTDFNKQAYDLSFSPIDFINMDIKTYELLFYYKYPQVNSNYTSDIANRTSNIERDYKQLKASISDESINKSLIKIILEAISKYETRLLKTMELNEEEQEAFYLRMKNFMQENTNNFKHFRLKVDVATTKEEKMKIIKEREDEQNRKDIEYFKLMGIDYQEGFLV